MYTNGVTLQESGLSFEFFPPKSEKGEKALRQVMRELEVFRPQFVSVTCGIEPSRRERTLAWARWIQDELGIPSLVHVTCLGRTREELTRFIGQIRDAGVRNILALRGDGCPEKLAVPGGMRYASDLVKLIRQEYAEATIAAAAYSEGHADALSREDCLENLKLKVEDGVDLLITQLFFDNRYYFDFVERARWAEIHVPILPGIMPITSLSQVEKFREMCNATVPPPLIQKLEQAAGDKIESFTIGVEHATAQCQELLDRGAPGIHFYTLNQSPATRLVARSLQSLSTVTAP